MAEEPVQVGFKVRPGGRRGRHYYQVVIYRTKPEMHEAYREWERAEGNGRSAFRVADYDAITNYAEPNERWQDANRCGFLRFRIGALSSDLVAHEMYHAARYWNWYDKGVRSHPDKPWTEERMAYAIGHLVAQFWAGLERLRKTGHIK